MIGIIVGLSVYALAITCFLVSVAVQLQLRQNTLARTKNELNHAQTSLTQAYKDQQEDLAREERGKAAALKRFNELEQDKHRAELKYNTVKEQLAKQTPQVEDVQSLKNEIAVLRAKLEEADVDLADAMAAQTTTTNYYTQQFSLLKDKVTHGQLCTELSEAKRAELEAWVEKAKEVIRKHRDARGHDRCHQAKELYQLLGEPFDQTEIFNLPPLAEWLPRCVEYWVSETACFACGYQDSDAAVHARIVEKLLPMPTEE